MTDRCQHADTVAAYLLGALVGEELTQFEAHVADCPTCHDDVIALRLVADALAASATPVPPPDGLRTRLMATVQAEAELLSAAGAGADRPRPARRRGVAPRLSRPLAVAGSALALVVAGLFGFGLATGLDEDPVRTVVEVRTVPAQVDTKAAPDATALVLLRAGAATMRVRGLPRPPRGYVYEVWLLRRGAAAPSPTDALFSVDRRGNGRVALPSVIGVETVLVTAEPEGGSQAPTSQPVISASL